MENKELKLISKKSEFKRHISPLKNIYNRNFPLSKWSSKKIRSFLKPGSLIVIAKIKQEIVGFACGRPEKNNGKKFYISALLVRNKFRGKGFAEVITRALIDNASRFKKFDTVCLHFRESKNLKKFYKKIGFRNHRIDGDYSNGEKKHYMEISFKK